MSELTTAIAACSSAATDLRKSQQGFDFGGHAPNHVAYDRRNAKGTVSHIQARGSRRVQPQHQAPAAMVNPARITKFSSGMTSITELRTGTSVLADSAKVGLGIDIGLLTAPAMQALANGIVNHRARVFIDSGAFSLFRKNLKALQTAQQLSLLGANEAPEWKTMDFEKVLAKYDAVMDAIEEANPAEEPITPPYFVMPDIIGDQAGTAELYRQHRDWISAQVWHNPNCIVPLQVGAKSLAEAYREIVGTIGSDNFICGIPSQEEAVSNQEVTEFLREIKPRRIHFLGAVAEATLAPRIQAVDASGHIPDISADGNILRSKLYGQEVEGANRREKVATVLKQELDLSEVYSRYLDQRSQHPMTKTNDLNKAIALGAIAAGILQKSHVSGYVRKNGTAVQEHEDSRARQKAHEDHTRREWDRTKTKKEADELTEKAERYEMSGWHEKAAEAHQEAHVHAREGHPAKRYHAEMVDYHKAEASRLASLNKSEATPTDADPLQKAIAGVQEAADQLQKSHVKQHTRTSASGAVTQVSAYDDKRKAAEAASSKAHEHQRSIGWTDDKKEAHAMAANHMDAAKAHIEAMKEAAKKGDHKAHFGHLSGASDHLARHAGAHTMPQDNEVHHANESAQAADHISEAAWKATHNGSLPKTDRDRPTAMDLDHGSSLHLLAMEQHGRAANAHQDLLRKLSSDSPTRPEVEDKITHHKEAIKEHGKQVQRLTGIAIKASNDAHAASEATKKHAGTNKEAASHQHAAKLHREAAKLNYDSEGSAEHEKKAQEHEGKASKSEEPTGRRLGAAHPDPLTKHAEALHKVAKKHDSSNNDRITLENAARNMKADDHESLADTLSYADTYQREVILAHVHPDHWEGLGMKHVDKARALKYYEQKHQGK